MASKPQNSGLWGRAKAAARAKFDVYPCVPLSARAVTRTGLMPHDQISPGDEILAYDMQSERLVWSRVEKVNRHENADLVRLFKKTGFSLLCTPDHRWIIEREMSVGGKTGPNGHRGERTIQRDLIPARDLNSHMDIVWCGKPLDGEGLFSRDWAKHDAWVPRVLSMTPSEREAFLASAIVYDGCDHGASSVRVGRTFAFTQKNEDHYFAAVLAAFCNGYYVSMHEKTETIRGAVFIRGKTTHNTQNLHMEVAEPQDVWCPTTAHGTWVMVQNGAICVTGNSAYANAWASKWYKSKGGKWSGDDNRVNKAEGGGLGKWFAEDWRDVKTGKECGRIEGEKGKRPYPACRPASAAASMSKEEKTSMARKKTGPSRKDWPVSPSGKRKEN